MRVLVCAVAVGGLLLAGCSGEPDTFEDAMVEAIEVTFDGMPDYEVRRSCASLTVFGPEVLAGAVLAVGGEELVSGWPGVSDEYAAEVAVAALVDYCDGRGV